MAVLGEDGICDSIRPVPAGSILWPEAKKCKRSRIQRNYLIRAVLPEQADDTAGYCIVNAA